MFNSGTRFRGIKIKCMPYKLSVDYPYGWRIVISCSRKKFEGGTIAYCYENKEQLLAVPKLDSSSGNKQSLVIFKALFDWGPQ